MSTKHLRNEAPGDPPARKKGVPKQKSGHADATVAETQAADAGAGLDNAVTARGHTGTPSEGQREVRMNVADRRPLPCPSDWTFELIEEYDTHIARVAEQYELDVYPIQLELISAEQMMDAYASVGMPVNYRHWSFGKHFLSTEKS